jgi:flagellin FlaB
MKKMRKLFKKVLKKDIGSIGIGAMIVFIAMVLVAGIAASVLVQTANKLEMQAMITGSETTAEVSTGITVFDIEGHVSGSNINWMTISVRPRAGSSPIDLEETVIEISDGDYKAILNYTDTDAGNFNTSVSSKNGQVFSTLTLNWDMGNNKFGILVLEDADSSISRDTPVINRGDSVMLAVNLANVFPSSSGIQARDEIWGQVIPEEGSFGVFSFRVPSSLNDEVLDLY